MICDKIEIIHQFETLKRQHIYLQRQYHELDQFNRIMMAENAIIVYELIAHSYKDNYLYCWYRYFDRYIDHAEIDSEWYFASQDLIATAKIIIFGCMHCKKVFRNGELFILHTTNCSVQMESEDAEDITNVFGRMLHNRDHQFACGEPSCTTRSAELFDLNTHMNDHDQETAAISQFMYAKLTRY